ncbi:MAG: reverse transcriptase/maturase family protein, partial [Nanoarchaeota archaeon]
VDHSTLIKILNKKIKDKRVMWLIKKILENYKYEVKGKGMPLENLTSQFFANIYLNELDQFIKHRLKIKHYIRYVDDFVILHSSKQKLEYYKDEINRFLKKELKLELHPDKSKIILINKGINLLGFRVFYHRKLLRKSNIRKFERELLIFKKQFDKNKIDYNKIYSSFEGWFMQK